MCSHDVEISALRHNVATLEAEISALKSQLINQQQATQQQLLLQSQQHQQVVALLTQLIHADRADFRRVQNHDVPVQNEMHPLPVLPTIHPIQPSGLQAALPAKPTAKKSPAISDTPTQATQVRRKMLKRARDTVVDTPVADIFAQKSRRLTWDSLQSTPTPNVLQNSEDTKPEEEIAETTRMKKGQLDNILTTALGKLRRRKPHEPIQPQFQSACLAHLQNNTDIQEFVVALKDTLSPAELLSCTWAFTKAQFHVLSAEHLHRFITLLRSLGIQDWLPATAHHIIGMLHHLVATKDVKVEFDRTIKHIGYMLNVAVTFAASVKRPGPIAVVLVELLRQGGSRKNPVPVLPWAKTLELFATVATIEPNCVNRPGSLLSLALHAAVLEQHKLLGKEATSELSVRNVDSGSQLQRVLTAVEWPDTPGVTLDELAQKAVERILACRGWSDIDNAWEGTCVLDVCVICKGSHWGWEVGRRAEIMEALRADVQVMSLHPPQDEADSSAPTWRLFLWVTFLSNLLSEWPRDWSHLKEVPKETDAQRLLKFMRSWFENVLSNSHLHPIATQTRAITGLLALWQTTAQEMPPIPDPELLGPVCKWYRSIKHCAAADHKPIPGMAAVPLRADLISLLETLCDVLE
eukprot:TRINITY_DN8364_c0_g1_i1.p1 TRINITY_DN8364_c0_g1~~TRINITY_DN8364_c0_g1_i1.p1  ORF type:complete len:636 (-),score=82.73 TRINITY_DN8364_c0_g1_i1:6-1913(-)